MESRRRYVSTASPHTPNNRKAQPRALPLTARAYILRSTENRACAAPSPRLAPRPATSPLGPRRTAGAPKSTSARSTRRTGPLLRPMRVVSFPSLQVPAPPSPASDHSAVAVMVAVTSTATVVMVMGTVTGTVTVGVMAMFTATVIPFVSPHTTPRPVCRANATRIQPGFTFITVMPLPPPRLVSTAYGLESMAVILSYNPCGSAFTMQTTCEAYSGPHPGSSLLLTSKPPASKKLPAAPAARQRCRSSPLPSG
eukprot:356395-Chlamydomonas_euryale.AAC.14